MSYRDDWPTKECLHCGDMMTPQTFFSSSLSRKEWEARKYCSPKCAARQRYGKPPEPKDKQAFVEHHVDIGISRDIDLYFLKNEVAEYEYEAEFDRFSD